VDRFEIADALEEIALHLEFRGENPFKSRAYANGARVLRELDADLDALVRAGELRAVPGIGAALAEKIAALATAGRLPYLEKLREETPPELLAWTRIPGLGPKKAKAIHEALGIRTLDELESAARGGRVRGLPGMGAATEAKILGGLERARKREGRVLMPVAHAEAARLVAALSAAPGVARAEAAGEVRRRLEVVSRLDLVAAAARPEAALDAFAAAPTVRAVTSRGPGRCDAVLASGLPVSLRAVTESGFAHALVVATGSEAHLEGLRARGLDAAAAAAPEDEAALYRSLGLDLVPPELREGLGEIEAAAAGTLPRLIERADVRGVLHVHSDWSDGRVSLEGMAEAVRALGFSYLGLCDHSRSAGYAGGLSEARVREQHVSIDALNARWGGAFRVLKGIEVDILADGSLDYDDAVLASFDLVVASVHSRFGLPEREQTERVLRALESPYVDVLGHPTGRLLLSREPYAIDVPRVVEAAAARGVAVEVNGNPHRLDLDWRELRPGLARGLLTSIDPDAHTVGELQGIDWGLAVARKGWCTPERTLCAWPLPRLLDHVAARRGRAGA
jgi:DNA polymerase (family 10)